MQGRSRGLIHAHAAAHLSRDGGVEHDAELAPVIEGADEKERGVVQIKDLILGAQIAKEATLEEWKDRPSQIEVPRDELVERVRAMIESQSS